MEQNRSDVAIQQDPRRGSISHFSLLNSLLAVINTERPSSTNATLAHYILDRFDTIGELNVYDVAEACFTSRSGIRRFCQSIGLDNFKDLKSYAWEWGEHHDLYVSYAQRPCFRTSLLASIDEMMEAINRQVDEQTLDDLAALIHDAQNVAILTSDFMSMGVRQFQQSMVYLGKIVYVLTDTTADLTHLGDLGPDDALIVVSEHGNYASAVLPTLEGMQVARPDYSRRRGRAACPLRLSRSALGLQGRAEALCLCRLWDHLCPRPPL